MKNKVLIIIGIIIVTVVFISLFVGMWVAQNEQNIQDQKFMEKWRHERELLLDEIAQEKRDKENNKTNSTWTFSEDYCGNWCDQNELYELGCDQPILGHLTKYSNLLDDEFDGTFNLDWIVLPDGVSIEKFEWCVDFIYDKRLPSEEELDISLDRWENVCSGGVPQCFGTFDNGTEVRIQCPDYPWKCGVTDFDNYKEVENEK